ncbi:peptide ligase PGM1-related protein [Actinomadura sp. ATCC 31491]|uniref:Peptide ligase PGM1-related protein n=1 Tax=Actinomadura luzonensis TaxID=2805427 RepID=A0ABT0G9W2_9ACTN|nr:peptide ligase PGM1-related protein [Actinomadura luzonensis]MCK2221376.1 peptide ligase PGM1-related protein [Actinomadura luzonensis]
MSIFEPREGTLVVVPSLSLPQDELRRIKAARSYEERLLFLLLTLREPGVKVIYLSSAPIDPDIIDYYFAFLPDPDDAAKRLTLITLDDPWSQPLTRTLLRRPDVLEQLRAEIDGDAWLVPFVLSELEEELASSLHVPIYGPATSYAYYGSKSGAREIGREAGVPMARGFGDVRTALEIEEAIEALPGERVIVKLNDAYSGLGNAIVTKADRSLISFSAGDETWEAFSSKIRDRGAVVEEFIEHRPLYYPSALACVSPGGHARVLATHDQVLGGDSGQVYQGCTFPAAPEYRAEVGASAERIARVLADRGVVGLFGMDFFALKADAGYAALLCEINLRIGGTTHPYGAVTLTTGAVYDPADGLLVADGRPKYYTATDNCAAPCLRGRTPGEVMRTADRLGLGFDHERRTGNVFHLLGAIPEHGKLGFTTIGDSREEADELHALTGRLLSGL